MQALRADHHPKRLTLRPATRTASRARAFHVGLLNNELRQEFATSVRIYEESCRGAGREPETPKAVQVD